jgi:thiol-disulfide isomerase/thioredoxin
MYWKSLHSSLLLTSLLLTAVVGCGPASPVVDTRPSEESSTPAPTIPDIPLQFASWEETQKLIAAHHGKVVVLDVWSTWCSPCLKEFPNLVKLHQQRADQVVCVSLNCNYVGLADEPPQQAQPDIEAFLRKQTATFENIICTDPDEQLLMKLNAASIPIVRVYDKQGKLSKQFVNDDDEYGEKGFTYPDHILPLVESLLK